MHNFNDKFFEHLPAILVVAVLSLIILITSIPAAHVEYHTVEVIKTEIVDNNNYMVFTKDATTGELKTFTLNDSLWHCVWDTADMYAKLYVGRTYRFEVTGWRIPILNRFQNIISIIEAP